MKTKIHGCASKDGEEIDGEEFECDCLSELMQILQTNKEVHINYMITDSGEDVDLDMGVKIE